LERLGRAGQRPPRKPAEQGEPRVDARRRPQAVGGAEPDGQAGQALGESRGGGRKGESSRRGGGRDGRLDGARGGGEQDEEKTRQRGHEATISNARVRRVRL